MSAGLVQISASRRDVLHVLAAALASGTGVPHLVSAQHVHQATLAEKTTTGKYRRKLFTAHEYATVGRLAELIIPSDERSGSAVEAGAPEFIDLLCSQNSQLASIFTEGLLWLDREMQRHHAMDFIHASEDRQIQLLDLLSAPPTGDPEPRVLAPGREFFRWVARMTVDAFYTSPMGIRDVGFLGNKGMTTYVVPAEAMQHALRHAGDD